MIHGTEPCAEGGDGGLLGEVDGLGADITLAGLDGGQGVPVAPGDDDFCPSVPDGEGDRARDPASPPDDEHPLVFQRPDHGSDLSRKRPVSSAAALRWLSNRK